MPNGPLLGALGSGLKPRFSSVTISDTSHITTPVLTPQIRRFFVNIGNLTLDQAVQPERERI